VNDPAAVSSGTAPVVETSHAAKTSEPAKAADTPTPAATGAASGWGTLKGRVVFEGDVPAAKVLVAKGDKEAKDADFCAKNEIDSERLVVNKDNKGVRYALVYIPKPTTVNPEAASAAKSAEVVFDQKNCTFVPHVLAAMKGATVTLKSGDAVNHNTDTVGLNNNKFNMISQANSSQPYPLKGVDKPGKLFVISILGWKPIGWSSTTPTSP